MELGVKFTLIVLILVKVSSRDVNETERAARAAFVQSLLNKQKHYDGRVRLYGGLNKFEGNVYIYHGGRWGAVCDDSWDDAAAQVVCKTWNRSGIATHGARYGEATRKFWMDDVVCEGTETSIIQCIFSGWGTSDCAPSEAAGAICLETPLNLVKPRKSRLHDALDSSASLRLTGGKNNFEGRVEIYHNGVWGSICPDGWTLYEALAVCRHLALGYASQALQTDYFGSSRVILSGVQCQGNETNLFMCEHQGLGDVSCPGDFGHVAAVICTDRLADLALDTTVIERTAHLQDVPMYLLQCAMEENCLSKSAYEIQKNNPDWQYETRRLLRFTASSLNIGNEEFRPYLPKHLWQWHLCHMHYHSMEVFATFDVLNSTGQRVAEGHKASFCLEDNTCLPGVERKYSCKNYGDQDLHEAGARTAVEEHCSFAMNMQDKLVPKANYVHLLACHRWPHVNQTLVCEGISVNCSDVYQYNIDCQWVDVTDVVLGDYTFKVSVNPHARIAEQQFHNNAATCTLRLADTYASVYGCRLERP